MLGLHFRTKSKHGQLALGKKTWFWLSSFMIRKIGRCWLQGFFDVQLWKNLKKISINPIHDLFKMVGSYLLTYFWLVWMGLIGHLSRRTFESTNCHGSWWDPGMVRWATRNKHFYFHGGTIELLVESHQVGSTTTVVFVGHQHHTTTYTTGICLCWSFKLPQVYVYGAITNHPTWIVIHIVTTNTCYQRSNNLFPYLFHAVNSTSKKKYQRPSKVKVNSIRDHYCWISLPVTVLSQSISISIPLWK